MVNKLIPHLAGYLLFQCLKFGMVEFDDLTGFDINQMFMMLA